jgi:hypothetical protein
VLYWKSKLRLSASSAFILRAKYTAADRKAMRKERNALKVVENFQSQRYDPALQEYQLNVVREDCYNITKERNSLILEVQHMGTDRGASEEVLDDDAILEERSDLIRGDCSNRARERKRPSGTQVQHRERINRTEITDRRLCATGGAIKLRNRKLRQHCERERFLNTRSPTDRSGKKGHGGEGRLKILKKRISEPSTRTLHYWKDN